MDDNGVLDAKDINWSLIKPSELRETQYKSQYAYVNYNDPKAAGGRLRVRLGKMRAPFGASSLANERGEISYDVNLAFTDMGAKDPELGESFKFCENWDNWVREEAKKKSKEWFNKRSVSDDIIEDKYKPMMIYSRDKKTKEIIRTYPPRIKVLLDKSRSNPSEFDTKVYTRETGKLPIRFDLNNFSEVIEKGDYIRPIIELKSLWFSSMGFGCKWRLFQGRVYKDTSSVLTDITGGSSDEGDLSDYETKQRKKRKTEECVGIIDQEKDEENDEGVV